MLLTGSSNKLQVELSADNSTCNLLELPVSNMTSGIYLIKVCMDDGSNETMKLIIK